MLFKEPLPFVDEFVDELDSALTQVNVAYRLKKRQKIWLKFCLMGALLTNTICWAKFERISLKTYSLPALSWVFRHSKIPWDYLLTASVKMVLAKYGIKEGVAVLDDSDRKRSKCTPRIFKTYKLKDKTTGGYINGQTIVLLLFVSGSVTFPVGFEFYRPDPAKQSWEKEEKRLKKKGIAKKDRPREPEPHPDYPTKLKIAARLLKRFKKEHSEIKINSIVADALYNTREFMDKASMIFDNTQVISQLHCNQNIRFRGRIMNVSEYFKKYAGSSQKIVVRGGQKIIVLLNSARLYVTSHGKKRFIIAIKLKGEEDYRYLVATDLSWRTIDIIQTYSLRWLIEVFFEDWKLYEGWGREAKQPDVEGSSRGLTLSLLLDICLLLHPEQLTQVKNKLPAFTVGSLQRKTQIDALFAFIRHLLEKDRPSEKLQQFSQIAGELFRLMPSKKHMSARDLGRMDSTPSLKYRALQAITG